MGESGIERVTEGETRVIVGAETKKDIKTRSYICQCCVKGCSVSLSAKVMD